MPLPNIFRALTDDTRGRCDCQFCHKEVIGLDAFGAPCYHPSPAPAPLGRLFAHADEVAQPGPALATHTLALYRAALEACPRCASQHLIAAHIGSKVTPPARLRFPEFGAGGWFAANGEGDES